MKFNKVEEPEASSDFYYDLFEGGYIKPEKMLVEKEDAKKVNDAIKLVKKFLEEAEEAGALESC